MLDIVVTQPLCGEGALGGPYTGTVIVDTINAVPPVTWSWSFGENTTTGLYTGLAPGKYYVTVTDGLDSTAVDSFEIIAPPAVAVSFSNVVTTSCPGTCDGGVTVTLTGGDPNLDYTLYWNNGQPVSATGLFFTITDLCGGAFPVSASQDALCFYSDTIDIPEPAPMSLALVQAVDASCHSASDGLLEVAAVGGTAPHTFAWDNMAAGAVNAGIPAGAYAVTVTDASGCTFADTFEIGEPDTLIAQIDSSATLPLSCGASNDGLIVVEASGGNPGGYTYTWNPNVSSSFQAVNLGVGTYAITVTDPRGCSDTTSYTLTAPEPIVVDWLPVADPSCFGDETVIMIGDVTGGSGNYSYNINGAQLMDITESVMVPSGIYIVSVFDDRGCSADTTYLIMEPNPILVSIDPEDPVVDLGDSILLSGVIVQSDNPVATYTWTSDGPYSCGTCQSTWASNDVPTVYTLSVTDINGCTGSADVLVEVDYDRDVYIPNIFSPNNDGRNDDFKVFTGLGVVSIDRIEIFDRWGNQLHVETDLLPSPTGAGKWDGTSRGQPLNPGVYVYIVQVRFIDNETVLTYRGDVTLLR